MTANLNLSSTKKIILRLGNSHRCFTYQGNYNFFYHKKHEDNIKVANTVVNWMRDGNPLSSRFLEDFITAVFEGNVSGLKYIYKQMFLCFSRPLRDLIYSSIHIVSLSVEQSVWATKVWVTLSLLDKVHSIEKYVPMDDLFVKIEYVGSDPDLINELFESGFDDDEDDEDDYDDPEGDDPIITRG